VLAQQVSTLFRIKSLISSLAIFFIIALSLAVSVGAYASDTIYAHANSAQVIKFTGPGSGSLFVNDAGAAEGGIAFDAAGNLYSADNFSSIIYKFAPNGTRTTFATSFLNHPSGLAIDAVGNVYAANLDNTISKFTPAGAGSIFASGLNGPLGLAFDSAGNLYSANFGNVTIYKITPDGVRTVFATDPGDNSLMSGPYGLVFDPAGNLFVANEISNTIEKFTPGGAGSLFANTGLNNPCGLVCDSLGNLYAANQSDGNIEKFTPGGAGSVFATGMTYGPVYLAIPEPTSGVIFALGWISLLVLPRVLHSSGR